MTVVVRGCRRVRVARPVVIGRRWCGGGVGLGVVRHGVGFCSVWLLGERKLKKLRGVFFLEEDEDEDDALGGGSQF